jgi:malonyl-CoA O-methyltransferase
MSSVLPPSSSPAPDLPLCAPSEVALARQVRRLAALAEPPWLHAEVARRLAEKLGPIKLEPEGWIDWSAFLGAGAELVQARYPQAQRWVVEPTPALQARSRSMLADQAERSWKRLWRRDVPEVWLEGQADAVQARPWTPDGAQMLWANMTLHAHADLPSLMGQWHRHLAVDGFLMCSGLGPDTARELRQVYQALGWPWPTIDFIDMHDLGDELVKAGFADPVMDMERLTLTWATPEAMLAELRTWGGNVAWGRHQGLRTPRWRDRLLSELAARLTRPDGRLGLTVEIVYGHAIKPLPRVKVAAEARVSLDDMKRMIRKQDKP